MASDRGVKAAASGIALIALGAAALAAWQHGLWATLTGAQLAAAWLVMLVWYGARSSRAATPQSEQEPDDSEFLPLRLLLDSLPVPLLTVEPDTVRTLNAAARSVFATDERVLPRPLALMEASASHLLYEGRRYRIDRIEAGASPGTRAIVALIDVEAEARTAEARATADMIQVLGHELLNGMAPIVSLAESGLAAISTPEWDGPLLLEILGTLVRRAEGLLRFTEAYRKIARLPDPVRSMVVLVALSADLERLFESRWSGTVKLGVRVTADATARIDRDQMTQAVWSLLQNAAEAAIKTAESPSVELTIDCEDGCLLIEVMDNGAGVRPEDIGQIFRPFHTSKPQGSGIGLSLARQITHAHGGELNFVASERTTFRINIPCDCGRRPIESADRGQTAS